MPTKLQSSTEYHQKFGENAKQFLDPKVGWAGLSSVDLANVMEPPLQRKKKPTEPQVHLSGAKVEKADPVEYVLLGDQGKFAANVKYNVKQNPSIVKKSFASPPKDKQPSPPDPAAVPVTPDAPRVIHPAPKVTVDTGAPQRVKRPVKPIIKVAHADTQINGVGKEKPLKAKPMEAKVPKPAISRAEPTHTEAKLVEKKVSKKLDQMNERVQTDLDRGIVDCETNAPANYGLAYKAGVAPARPQSLKRVSEYQSRFQWKDPVGSSPMLAAEQIVYNSQANIGQSGTSGVIPTVTEYRKQFQPWHITRSVDDQHLRTAADPTAVAAHIKQRMKRSKSLEAAARRPAAGVPSGLIGQKAEALKTAMNPQTLHFPHGTRKVYTSEYATNFKAPSDFAYKDGAWSGAKPPHLQQVSVSADNAASATASAALSSWFKEVAELRERAMEYKKRARGTHFSREHLVQLFAQQNQLWDTVSSSRTASTSTETNGNNVPPLLLEPSSHSSQSGEHSVDGSRTIESKSTCGSTPPSTPRDCWSETSLGQNVASKATAAVQSTIATKATAATQATVANGKSTQQHKRNSASSSVSGGGSTGSTSSGGRVPTPKIHHTPVAAAWTRHHLDRTTPAVGGALLTAPSKQKYPQHHSPPVADAHTPDEISPSQQRHEDKGVQCTCGLDRTSRRPSDSLAMGLVDRSPLRSPTRSPSRTSSWSPPGTVLSHHPSQSQQSAHQHTTASSVSRHTNSSVGVDQEVALDGLSLNHVNTHLIYNTNTQPRGDGGSSSPMLGMPTQDDHILLDEERSVDQPLHTQYVHTLLKDPPARRELWKLKHPELSIPSTVLEQTNGVGTIEDDALSMSARSVASSCSLASEVLERAKNRRDQFWSSRS